MRVLQAFMPTITHSSAFSLVRVVGTMRYACCVIPRMYRPWNYGRLTVTCDPACGTPCPVGRACA
eukprot:7241611-Prymnesium_polylepis.1